MANKYDLNGVFQSLTLNTEDCVVIGPASTTSAVPTGRTRFLTYLRIERTGVMSATPDGTTALTAVVASVTTASNISSPASAIAYGKLWCGLAEVSGSACSGGVLGVPPAALATAIPAVPNMEHPIVSVAGGSCMIVYVNSGGPNAQLIAQYYDEPAST